MTIILLLFIAGLSFANGANDNCKGVATLVGYGVAKPTVALAWAMITTLGGAIVSFWLAGGLVKTFSTALFATAAPLNASFFVAVVIGASGWVLLATRTGLPVSTTHAIMGGLLGAGVVSFGSDSLRWTVLGATSAMPLVFSPVLSLLIVYLAAWPLAFLFSRTAGKCVCVTETPAVLSGNGVAAIGVEQLGIVVDRDVACAAARPVAGISSAAAANGVHWMSSGMVGFARGWNDAPKIAALGLLAVSGQHGAALCFAIVAVAMAAGGILGGRRVLETLATKVTAMPLAESLTASLVTATLVGLASWHSLPVSTTHVSTGAIVGAGIKRDPRRVAWNKVGQIVFSWLVTLPVAALIAAVAALVFHCGSY